MHVCHYLGITVEQFLIMTQSKERTTPKSIAWEYFGNATVITKVYRFIIYILSGIKSVFGIFLCNDGRVGALFTKIQAIKPSNINQTILMMTLRG